MMFRNIGISIIESCSDNVQHKHDAIVIILLIVDLEWMFRPYDN